MQVGEQELALGVHAAVPTGVSVTVLGEFRVLDANAEVRVCAGSQRVLAFLALRPTWVQRTLVAGTLWPDVSDARAHASLRSALSRMHAPVRDSIEVLPAQLRIARGVSIDLVRSRALALRLLAHACEPTESDLSPEAIAALSADLLPDWYEDWALLEVEDWRQLRLHALEAVAAHLMVRARYAEAVRAAIAAVKADPLRESPHTTLIRVHLAEGNRSEAVREFALFKDLLATELHIGPSAKLRELMHGVAAST